MRQPLMSIAQRRRREHNFVTLKVRTAIKALAWMGPALGDVDAADVNAALTALRRMDARRSTPTNNGE